MRILVVGDDPGEKMVEGEAKQNQITRVATWEEFTEGTFDQIYLTGVVELLPREQVVDALKAYGPHLAEMGELHVRVPSLEWAAREIATQDSPDFAAYHWLYGSVERPHRCGMTVLWLRLALLNAGYNVRRATQLVVKVGDVPALENYAIAVWKGSDEANA